METLYLTNVSEDEFGMPAMVVIATVSKDEDGYYQYTPYNLDKDDTLRLQVPQRSKRLPNILASRVLPESRFEIQELIAVLGLDKYDPWEILKVTKGRMRRDNTAVLTETDLANIRDVVSGNMQLRSTEQELSAWIQPLTARGRRRRGDEAFLRNAEAVIAKTLKSATKSPYRNHFDEIASTYIDTDIDSEDRGEFKAVMSVVFHRDGRITIGDTEAKFSDDVVRAISRQGFERHPDQP